MRNLVFAVSLLALAGCHARWFPLASPPGYSLSHESADGTLNKKLKRQAARLREEDNHYMAGFRYDLPAPGSLIAQAKPVNPAAQISVAIYAEGGGEPIAKGEPGKKVEATELQPGTYTLQCLVVKGVQTHATLGMEATLTVK